MKEKPLLVIGAGTWGTALAIMLARNGYAVLLWGRDPQQIANMQTQSCNPRYLPDITFPDNLQVVDDLVACLDVCDVLVLAVPCSAMREILNVIAEHSNNALKLCLTSKGLENKTLLLNHQVVDECLGAQADTVVLSGPTFAKEIAMGLPTAVTIAGENIKTTTFFSEKFHSETFRTYISDDIVGVQIGGAVKNVMAIAAGITDGLQLGANARSALITRGFSEIIRLGMFMGGQKNTLIGLSGLGDLILTCSDNQSRNRRFGLELAKGATTDEACNIINQVVEGLHTTHAVRDLAVKNNIDMPITEQVYQVVTGRVSPQEATHALLLRTKKQEFID